MIDWSQGEVQSDGATLRYSRSGGDLPPLVMVHGLTDHALYFTRVADVLAERWDAVDALELDRLALVGHSMGGGTIALALATHPDISCGAVLEDPNWWEPPTAKLVRRLEQRKAYFVDWRASLAELQHQPRRRTRNPGTVVSRADAEESSRLNPLVPQRDSRRCVARLHAPPARHPDRFVLRVLRNFPVRFRGDALTVSLRTRPGAQ